MTFECQQRERERESEIDDDDDDDDDDLHIFSGVRHSQSTIEPRGLGSTFHLYLDVSAAANLFL